MVVTVATLVFGVFGGSTIDGFTLGSVVKCSPPLESDPVILDRSCAGYPKRASEALDARDPGHAAIVSMEAYTDGTQPGPIDVTGPGEPPTPAPRNPGPNVTVFVFKLADGSTREFLEDGDTVTITARTRGRGGVEIGFGEVTGTILPAVPASGTRHERVAVGNGLD